MFEGLFELIELSAAHAERATGLPPSRHRVLDLPEDLLRSCRRDAEVLDDREQRRHRRLRPRVLGDPRLQLPHALGKRVQVEGRRQAPLAALDVEEAVVEQVVIFPFETEIYDRAGVAATYVGHPLASDIPLEPNTQLARKQIAKTLNIESSTLDGVVVAVLPGSRGSEIELIAPVFFETMQLLTERLKGQKLHFLIPVATPQLREPLEQLLLKTKNMHPDIQIHLLDGMADEVLEASDVVLIASGTATLQAALWKKPMVISYKVPWLTAQIMKRQGYLPYVGLPNILCEAFVVPELLQDDATPEKLASALQDWLEQPMKVAELKERFAQMHETLRRPTGLLVAQAVAQTIASAGKQRVAQ